ncbi:glutamate-gated chloride channel-like [Cimex lectularius]|uniref:Uncharacterized protein n=1 Tax=Cimex lectularius TaxID=79782 RepID=A0A8I6S282_CIMLE|nr:glutamate-gated chloride channel-like [Cimex lectularius]
MEISNVVRSLSFLLALCWYIPSIYASREAEIEKIHKEIFKSKYTSTIRPPGTNGNDYVTITTNMFILDISSIDDYEMQYTIQLYLRQKWVDERLQFKHLSENISHISINDVNVMWTPDLFFVNEIDGNHHQTMKTNQFARIQANGSVLYSVKLTLILSCPMKFQLYPFDHQKCPLRIESYGWSKKDLLLKFDETQAIQLNPKLRVQEFDLYKVIPSTEEVSLSTGTFIVLEVGFFLLRRINYFFFHLYIPTSMLVFTSWTSFWFGPNQVVARTIIGMSTFFITINLITSFNVGLPKVSYIRAIDVWSGTCLIFVFIAFMEFFYVSYTYSKHSQTTNKSSSDDDNALETKDKSRSDNSKSRIPLQKWLEKVSDVNSVDKLSRSVFPLAFVLFIVVYFSIYLSIK